MYDQHAIEVLGEFGFPTGRGQLSARGGAGGFSGALIWKLDVDSDAFCLRRWPRPHPDANRLQMIHQALIVADHAGVSGLPVPIRQRNGGTFVERDAHFWELTLWLPGKACFQDEPTDVKLAAALKKLAEFHLAVADVVKPRHDTAPAVNMRIEILQVLKRGQADLIGNAVKRSRNPQLEIFKHGQLAENVIAEVRENLDSALSELREVASMTVPLQFCIRDVWHDHLLFVSESVSGIVDFGASNIDVVSTDLARLIGSLVADDDQRRNHAIAAYETVRQLSAGEKRLISMLDRSAVLVSGMNWLRWLFVENRQFEDLAVIAGRLQTIRGRLNSFYPRKDFTF